MGSFREPNEAKISVSRANCIVEDVRAKQKAVKMQPGLISCFWVSAELLKKGVLKRVTKLVAEAFVKSTDKPGRIKQGFVIIFRRYSNRNKNSLLTFSFTPSELTL